MPFNPDISPYEEEVKEDSLSTQLNKLHKESNESRIKLVTLTHCYNNLCEVMHIRHCMEERIYKNQGSYKSCSNPVCMVNYDVIVKLGL